jgi:hypothetical protein
MRVSTSTQELQCNNDFDTSRIDSDGDDDLYA